MAEGRVLTGFSHPWVGAYNASGGVVSYTNGMDLARGVSVQLSIEGAGDNNFYANNVLAESDNQAFSSGTADVTVDGLKDEARRMCSGVVTKETVQIPGTETSVSLDVYDDLAVIPYLGFGFIARYMEDGVTTYVPYILRKIKFSPEGLEANTQEENIDFQTQSLEATIYRDDTPNHRWQMVGDAQTTEDAAYAVLKAVIPPATAAAQTTSNSTRSAKG